jgi:hypothetical protein
VPRHRVVSSYVDIGCCPVLNQTDKLLVGLVYRSPSNRTSENSDNLGSLISEETNKGYSHIQIKGDFNYPDID